MNSPRNANKFMFFLLIYLLVIPYIYVIIVEKITGSTDITPLFYGIYSIICFIIPSVVYRKINKLPITSIIPVKKLKWKNIILIIMISISVQPILSLISAVTSLVFGNNVGDMLYDYSNYSYPAMMIAMAVIPAVCEEIAFRGVLLSGYKVVGIEKAALVTGLFFGIMHLNPQQFLYALFMGILFAYFVYYTNSIFSSILSHFIINGCQITAVYLNNYFYPGSMVNDAQLPLEDKLTMIQDSAYTALIFIPVLIGLLALFMMLNKKLKLDLIKQVTQRSTLIEVNERPSEKDTKILTLFFWLILIVYAVFLFLQYFS